MLEAFARTEMGEACALYAPDAARRRFPQFTGAVAAVLWSPVDLRVESREAMPCLAAWLAARGVAFLRGASVLDVSPPAIRPSLGTGGAGRGVGCPGGARAGVHLIAVQSADGSLVVGDTHHHGITMDPFAETGLDRLVLDELEAVLPDLEYGVVERWTGTYASHDDRLMVADRVSDAVRLVIITRGTGASTSFAIAEEVIEEMFA